MTTLAPRSSISSWETVRRELTAQLLPKARTSRAFVAGLNQPKGLEWAAFFLRPIRERGLLSPDEIERGLIRAQEHPDLIASLMEHRVELLGGYAPQQVGDPIDWFHMPEGDAQWATHLSRHYWLAPLAFAWRATGNPAYGEKIASILLDWVERNPLLSADLEHLSNDWPRHYASPESEPASGEGYFPGYPDGPWTALSAHFRVEWWTKLFQLAGNAPAFTNEVVGRLLLSLMREHLQIMFDFPRQMNQFQGIATSLVDLGFFYPQFSVAEASRREGWERLRFYAEQEIYPDGSVAECSPNYGMTCLERLYDVMERAEQAGDPMPASLQERVQRAMRYFALTSDPSGRSPRIAKGGGFILDSLARINTSFGDPEVAFIASQGTQGNAPKETCFSFDWAGHQVFRSGWDTNAVWLFFESGPRGSGHHDQAQLSIQLRAAGEWLLVDPGFHSYSGGEAGRYSEYLRRTAAHSTALVDGEGQISSPSGTALTPNTCPDDYHWSNGAKIAVAEGTYDLGFGNGGKIQVGHRRQVSFFKEESVFQLTDTFDGAGEHTVWLHWQTPPDAEVELNATCFRIRGKHAVLHVELENDAAGDFTLQAFKGVEAPLLGWYSEKYGELQKTTTVRVAWRGTLPCCFRSTLRIELLNS